MPEGPEIRREADALAHALAGKALLRVEYRVPGLARVARQLGQAKVTAVTARGKAMLISYDNGLTHYSHNQLYGSWRVDATGEGTPASGRAIRVVLATERHVATLYSATDIALLDARALAGHAFLAALGPDVLDRTTTPRTIATRLADPRFARRSLAALLLDQAFIAGLGNYLRSDILFAAKLRHTLRPAELSDSERSTLAAAIHALPRQSYRTHGITNELARAQRLAADGVAFADYRFLAYGRDGRGCYGCTAPIRRAEVGGRGVFFCPRCQRR
jgi:endonuclease VIII